MANPWKAIADMIYSRKKQWSDVSMLMDDLRIEPNSIINSNLDLLSTLASDYPHKFTQKIVKNIINSISRMRDSNHDN